jgi:hypothetical protein
LTSSVPPARLKIAFPIYPTTLFWAALQEKGTSAMTSQPHTPVKGKVLDTIEYVSGSGTTYLRTFGYDSAGNLTGSMVLRVLKDGQRSFVQAAYLSESEYNQFTQEHAAQPLYAKDLVQISDIKRQESDEANGYMLMWEELPDKRIKLQRSGRITYPPKRTFKTLEKEADKPSPSIMDSVDVMDFLK